MDIDILDHPLVTYGAGIVLSLQLLAMLGYRRMLGRYLAKVAILRKGGFQGLATDEQAFGWFAWLRGQLLATETGRPAAPDRTSALTELDWHLQSSAWLGLLQRLGYAAPLVGLLLTALGFFLFNPPSGGSDLGSDLGSVLRATLPLMLGVAVGATLALFNQFLLLLVTISADRARASTRDWFDDAALSAPSAANPLAPAAQSIQTSVCEIAQSIRQFHAAADGAKAATDRLTEVAVGQQRATGELAEKIGVYVGLTTRLEGSVSAAGEAMAQLTTWTMAHAGSLESGLSAQSRWTEAGARAAGELAGAVTDLRSQLDQLRHTVETQRRVVGAWQVSVEQQLVPVQSAFVGAITEFRSAAVSLTDGVGTLGSAAQSAADQVGRLSGTTEAAVARFGATVGTLAATVEDSFLPLAQSLAPIQGVVDQIGQVGAPLAAAALAVAEAARQHHASADQLAPAYQQLTATLATAVERTDDLRQLHAATAPATQAITQSVAVIAEAARQIGALSAGGLEPMAARLSQIEQAVGTLTTFVGSLQPLTGTGELVAEIRRLATAFDHMERAADQQRQIAELLRDIAAAARHRTRPSLFARIFGK